MQKGFYNIISINNKAYFCYMNPGHELKNTKIVKHSSLSV